MNNNALAIQKSNFEEKVDNLKRIFEEIREGVRKGLFQAAHIFKSFGPGELKQAKKRLKGIVSGETIDRLVLFADGKMQAHLAFMDRGLPARHFLRLPDTAQKVLNDPEQNVEVLTESKGVRIKKVRELTGFELHQIADPQHGIRTPQQQKAWLPKPGKGKPGPKPKKAESTAPIIHVEKIEVDRKDRHYLILTGRDDDRTEYAVRVKDSMIRKFFM